MGRSELQVLDADGDNFMNVAAVYSDKSEIISDLPLSVAYRLASPHVPEPTRNEILSRREAGDRVDEQEIGDIIFLAIRKAREAKAAEKEADPKEKAKRKRRLAKQKRVRAKWEDERAEQEAKRRRREKVEAQLLALITKTLVEAGATDEVKALLDQLPGFFFDSERLLGALNGALHPRVLNSSNFFAEEGWER
jgi:hypothetical protein